MLNESSETFRMLRSNPESDIKTFVLTALVANLDSSYFSINLIESQLHRQLFESHTTPYKMPWLTVPCVMLFQNQRPLNEYIVTSLTPSTRNEAYVEVANDGPFEIRIGMPGWIPLVGDCLVAEVFIDGHRVETRKVKVGFMEIIAEVRTEGEDRPLLFQPLETIENGREDVSKHLGEITVKIHHGRHNQEASPKPEPDIPTLNKSHITGEALKKRSISHSVALGDPIKKPHTPRTPWRRVCGTKPLFDFTFIYCDRKTLEARGIIRGEATSSDQQGVGNEQPVENATAVAEEKGARQEEQEHHQV